MNYKSWFKNYDFVLIILVCTLIILGLTIISSVSNVRSVSGMGFFNKQKLFFAMGLFLLIITSRIDYKFICKLYIPIYIFNIFLLLLVMLLPSAANENTNTARWIPIGNFFSIQPSEFSKLFMVIVMAKIADKNIDTINELPTLLYIFIVSSIPTFLILYQPSLSASLVNIVLLISILFVAKLNYKYFLISLAVIIPLLAILFIDLRFNNKFILTNFQKIGLIKEYQMKRINAFIDKDPTSEDYDRYFRQSDNSISAVGSGKVFGKGLYKGTTKRLGLIANNENDFIFSVVGEEFGFIGSTASIILILLIILRCIYIGYKTNSNLARLIVAGISGMFAFQVFVNVCVATGLLPNTGMPFPFLSYGGSSLWVNMTLIGVVLNIGLDRPKSIFEG